MNSAAWAILVGVVLVLWAIDHFYLEARTLPQMPREEFAALEKKLQKERRDAVAELNMIQSRLILFMKLESEIIEKERATTTEMRHKSEEIKALLARMDQEKSFWKENITDQVSQIQTIASEKAIGFPWLAKAYAEFFYLQDMRLAAELEKSAGVAREKIVAVREMASQRRIAEEKLRLATYLLEYYECLFPRLAEFRDSGIDELIADREKALMEQLHMDPIGNWLSDRETRELPPTVQLQTAVARFQAARTSKWQLDQDYERFLAHRYETQGWQVRFIALQEEFPEFLRVLLALKGGQTWLIQGRHTPFQPLFIEKLLLNFFFLGVETVRNLRAQNPGDLSLGDYLRALETGTFKLVFVTSQVLPESAQALARLLNITVDTGQAPEPFPAVKGRQDASTGERRLYLPFDREYDNLNIEETTEAYFATVAEAEAAGFKRVIKPLQIPEGLADLDLPLDAGGR